MENDTYQTALEALTAVFSDRTTSRREALSNLRALKDEIDVFVDALENDGEPDEE